jgi:hypothetical protein
VARPKKLPSGSKLTANTRANDPAKADRYGCAGGIATRWLEVRMIGVGEILRCAQDDGVTATARAKAKPNATANTRANGPAKPAATGGVAGFGGAGLTIEWQLLFWRFFAGTSEWPFVWNQLGWASRYLT